MTIRLIHTNTADYEAMIALRMKVLLDPIGIPRSYINPQKEAADLLVAAFTGDELIGCCVLTHVDDATIQLRQMAVANNLQQKGVGKAIVAFAEGTAKQKGYTTLMMHARETVVDFYKKCGYRISGGRFFEVGIGHFKMEKQLAL